MITVSISIVGIDSANSKNNKLQLNFLQFIKIQKVLVLKKIKHLLGLLLIYENTCMLIKNMLINYIKDLTFLAFYGLNQCNTIPWTVTNLVSNYLFNQSEDFKLWYTWSSHELQNFETTNGTEKWQSCYVLIMQI